MIEIRHEFEKRMKDTYPLLYKDMYASPMRSCMAFGFDIGPGWYPIIEKLSAKLENLIQKYKNEHPDLDKDYLPRASQVKEKYGTLRFYMISETEEMIALIDEAEEISKTVCEECGQPGVNKTSCGWYITMCDKCRKERDKRLYNQKI